MQQCDYCGADMGVFAHSRSLDGPLVCGARECSRDARDDERAAHAERRERAEEDGFERYGGGW